MKRKSQNKKVELKLSNKIKLYSTPSCIWCQKTREFFIDKGVDFEDINVGEDKKKAKEMIEISGQMGVPVIIIGKEVIIGFDRDRLEKLIC